MVEKSEAKWLLAIETSCDETSAAVLDRGQIRSNVILSQDELIPPMAGLFLSWLRASILNQ